MVIDRLGDPCGWYTLMPDIVRMAASLPVLRHIPVRQPTEAELWSMLSYDVAAPQADAAADARPATNPPDHVTKAARGVKGPPRRRFTEELCACQVAVITAGDCVQSVA